MINELLKELVDAGVHYGHQTKKWNARMVADLRANYRPDASSKGSVPDY